MDGDPNFNKHIAGVSKFYPLPFLPQLLVTSNEMISKITTSTFLVNKGIVKNVVEDAMGKSLLTDDLEIWRKKRKLLMKTMHKNMLDQYSYIINQQMYRFTDMIHEQNNQELELEQIMLKLNLDLAATNIFGQKLDATAEEKEDMTDTWLDVVKIMQHRIKNPILVDPTLWFLWNKFCNNNGNFKARIKMDRLVEKLLVNRKKLLQNESQSYSTGGKKRNKIIADLLLELNRDGSLTFQEMKNEAALFFAAAIDTTTNSVAAVIYCLAQKCNEKILNILLKNEIDHFFPEKEDLKQFDNETNVIPILNNMPYLDAVIKEALRLYGPGSHLNRAFSNKDGFTFNEKVHIPGDLGLECLILNGWRTLEDFDSKFLPERFLSDRNIYDNLDQRVKKLSVQEFMPFSDGPRNCIGKPLAYLQIKMELIHILRNFRIEIVVKTEDDLKEIRPCSMKFVRKFEISPTVRFVNRE